MFVNPCSDEFNIADTPDDEYAHFVTAKIDNNLYGEMHPIDADGKACVELYFERHMAKCVLDDNNMADDDIVVMQMLLVGLKQ